MAEELNKGIAIIIDEQIDDVQSGDLIIKIAAKVKEQGIPFCSFTTLKDARACLKNFLQVNFLILDWQLIVSNGAPEQIKDANAKENIKFIEEFRQVSSAPIFIFSSLAEVDIKDYFVRFGKGILKDNTKKDFILIKTKSSVSENNDLFSSVEIWLKSNPAIYTLKKWENAFLEAKNKAFSHLFTISPIWSKILWDTATVDQIDESTNLNDIIYKSIKSRTSVIDFDKDIIDSIPDAEIDADEIKSVIIAANYLSNENISINDVQPGDIFKVEKKYYINFRPVCDTVISRPACDKLLYCLKGDILSAGQVKDRYNEKYKMLIDKNNEIILYGIDGKKFVNFPLNSFEVFEYDKIKDKRIQRLLPPYSNYLQQSVSSYLQRVGLPRTPHVIIENALPQQT